LKRTKLVIRILLPLIVFGIGWCINVITVLIVYGNYEQRLKNGAIDDSSIIATHLFLGFIPFILIMAYFIHYGICKIDDIYKLKHGWLALITSVILVFLSTAFIWSPNMEYNISVTLDGILNVFPAIFIYFYGIKYTKLQYNKNELEPQPE